MKFLLGLITIQLYAAPINPRLMNLIMSDVHIVSGIDLERHQESALGVICPDLRVARQVIDVGREGSLTFFTALVGEYLTADPNDAAPGTVLDGSIIIRGNEGLNEQLARLWLQSDVQPTLLAYRVQQLSGLYDDWFVIVRPLDFPGGPPAPWPTKRREDFIGMVEEISGGIRFGTNIECKLEALMRTDDDAKTLAGLESWLPGIVQSMSFPVPITALLDLAEDISVSAEGRIVTLSFHVSENKLKESIPQPAY
jgi:hypothetical protein